MTTSNLDIWMRRSSVWTALKGFCTELEQKINKGFLSKTTKQINTLRFLFLSESFCNSYWRKRSSFSPYMVVTYDCKPVLTVPTATVSPIFPQAPLSHSSPQVQLALLGCASATSSRKSRRAVGRSERTKKESRRLTCESRWAFAGVLWGGWRLTRGCARGSIGAAVWLDQAGVAHVLAELAGPSRRANTLQRDRTHASVCANIPIHSNAN